MDDAYLKELAQLVQARGLKAGRADLSISIKLGVLSFLQDWFAGDTNVQAKVAIFGAPDIWGMSGRVPVPECELWTPEHPKLYYFSVTLDGVAKGYIAQAMARVLAQTGLANYMVNAGGDIVASGLSSSGAPWRVAVEDPLRAGAYPCAVSLTDRSLATSGVYEQVLLDGSRSHLVIPASQAMADCVSASVAAPDCALADALATAFAVMEPAKAVQLADAIPGVGCLLLLRSGGSLASRGWSA